MAIATWPTRPSRLVQLGRYCRCSLTRTFVACLGLFLCSIFLLLQYRPGVLQAGEAYLHALGSSPASSIDSLWSTHASTTHPIDTLIAAAAEQQKERLFQRSFSVASAARAYRARRGRHPPPGFDKWVEYALAKDAVVVESFFDRIYHDVAPFWALDARWIAAHAASWPFVMRVRGGNATGVGDTSGKVPWLQLYTDLVKEAAEWLPDVDMPINYMDESRLLVPWEKIAGYVAVEQRTRAPSTKGETTEQFEGLAWIEQGTPEFKKTTWHGGDTPIWDLVRATCPPDSEARNAAAITDYSSPPEFGTLRNPLIHHSGFISNFTAATDPCLQPHLRGLHGSFIEPVSVSMATELIPLFGGSKLPPNNEIIIPGAMYLTDDPFYSGGEATHGPPWQDKSDTPGLIWRGAASGGRHRAENWHRFQRHRLLEMLNGSTVLHSAETGSRAPSFDLAQTNLANLSRTPAELGEWLTSFASAGFVNLLCFPSAGSPKTCPYLAPSFFHTLPGVPMAEQYQAKFLPDVDGNSFSARFRGLLRSTSLPLKATLYAEWHDDRLLPWLHFVPLDNGFGDLYAVLDYFTRDGRGDKAAEVIAEAGREWSERVLRREDMLLYTWRVLLEFARVCDPGREGLGFVGDL